MPETKPRQRSLRSDAGIKRGPRPGGKLDINITLNPANLAWARHCVEQGGYPSVSAMIDSLLAQDQIASHIV